MNRTDHNLVIDSHTKGTPNLALPKCRPRSAPWRQRPNWALWPLLVSTGLNT